MILDNKLATEKEIKALEKEINDGVKQAIKQSEEDALPPVSELFEDVTDDPVGSGNHYHVFI